MVSGPKREFAGQAEHTAERQQAIQDHIDAADRSAGKQPEGAVQAGQRPYPASPMPAQHHEKPGHENEIQPAPMFEAPAYKGSEKLKDKVALITGGDSGIGRAVAVLYAREGADIAIAYLNEHKDAAETRLAVEREGRKCLLMAGDVGDPAFCRHAIQETLATFGHLDILVNNAAFQLHVPRLEDLTDDHFDQTMKTNLYGYFYMAKAAVPHLPQGGAILNTGSIAGIDGSATLLDYSMTKGGIHAFTRALSAHLAPRGIRVNAIAPGPVWTPLNPADRPPEEVAKFGAQTRMKRPAQPEEIAPAYVFLAAPSCSSYITGEILPIIGGY